MKHLFFWKGIEEASFKKIEDGYAFFAYGIFSAGYAVTEAQKDKIAKFLRTFYTVATIGLLVTIFTTSLVSGFIDASASASILVDLVFVIALLVWYRIKIGRMLIDVAKTRGRRTYRAEEAVANSLSSRRIAAQIFAGVFMTVGSGVVFIMGLNSGDKTILLIGAAGTVLFVLSLIKILRLRAIKQNRRQ